MPTIIKFTYNTIAQLGIRDYSCDRDGDASEYPEGCDWSGEYVPLAEWQQVEAENARLRELIARVVELGALDIYWILEYHNHVDKAEVLEQLLADCRAVVE